MKSLSNFLLKFYRGAQEMPTESFRDIVLNMFSLGDLLLIHARPKMAADELSAHELEVAQRYAAGEGYKTIAQWLSVSPSTII